MKKAGFTLIELLIAVALMAMLSTLLFGVFSNCRRAAAAAETQTDRQRRELLLREILQTELDRSSGSISFEYSAGRLSGFNFASYGEWAGRQLRIRTRYVFEPDPERPAFRLMRYVIADGIGVKETKEVLLEGIREPVIEGYSEAANEFVPAEKIPKVPDLIRLKFRLIRDLPKSFESLESVPADDIRLMLTNGYADKSS